MKSEAKVNLAGTLTDIKAFAVWRPAELVQICLGDGSVLMEMDSKTALQLGCDLIAHAGDVPWGDVN